jgi:hypothetical protein
VGEPVRDPLGHIGVRRQRHVQQALARLEVRKHLTPVLHHTFQANRNRRKHVQETGHEGVEAWIKIAALKPCAVDEGEARARGLNVVFRWTR